MGQGKIGHKGSASANRTFRLRCSPSSRGGSLNSVEESQQRLLLSNVERRKSEGRKKAFWAFFGRSHSLDLFRPTVRPFVPLRQRLGLLLERGENGDGGKNWREKSNIRNGNFKFSYTAERRKSLTATNKIFRYDILISFITV